MALAIAVAGPFHVDISLAVAAKRELLTTTTNGENGRYSIAPPCGMYHLCYVEKTRSLPAGTRENNNAKESYLPKLPGYRCAADTGYYSTGYIDTCEPSKFHRVPADRDENTWARYLPVLSRKRKPTDRAEVHSLTPLCRTSSRRTLTR